MTATTRAMGENGRGMRQLYFTVSQEDFETLRLVGKPAKVARAATREFALRKRLELLLLRLALGK